MLEQKHSLINFTFERLRIAISTHTSKKKKKLILGTVNSGASQNLFQLHSKCFFAICELTINKVMSIAAKKTPVLR